MGADAEYPQNALVGARELIKKFGFKTVYDKTYPPSTVDFTPIVRAIKATNPDVVFVASYPPDSVGMLRAAHEVGLQPKLFGGGMVGLQFTSVMASMGPMLNGIVNYDFWAPESTMMFPGIKEFFKEYQARAEKAGVDPLGYYLPPYSYAVVQVLGQAIEATKSLDQQKLADYIRATEFNTIVGKVKFGKNGEWAKGRTLMVQYQKIAGHGHRSVPGAGQEGRALSRRAEVRQHHLPVRGGEELARALPVLLGPARQRDGRRAAARGLLCRREPRRIAHLRAARHRQHRAARVRDPRLLRRLRDATAPSASIRS